MSWPHFNPLPVCSVEPAISDALAGKGEAVFAILVDDGQLQIAVKGS